LATEPGRRSCALFQAWGLEPPSARMCRRRCSDAFCASPL